MASKDYTLKLSGRASIEAHVHIDHGDNTSSAYGIGFNDDGGIIAETDSTRYGGFCDAEIVYHELLRLIAYRWGIESGDIAEAVDALGLTCTCEEN